MNVDALFASPWGALVIFFLRIIGVSCDTMRVIFATREWAVGGPLGRWMRLRQRA
jgi:hypothetical protein